MTSRIGDNTPRPDVEEAAREPALPPRRSHDADKRKRRRRSPQNGREPAPKPVRMQPTRSRFARTAASRAESVPSAADTDSRRIKSIEMARASDFTAAAPVRKRKETASREPAIWRGDVPAGERTIGGQHVEGRGRIRWRLLSGFVALAMTGVLAYLFVDDSFYVRPENFSIGGISMMTREEVIALTNVLDMHLFWIDPALVRADLLNSPTIADAQVDIGWSPNMVQILVREREPVFLWQSGEQNVWIDLQGRVMQRRGERDLLRVVADIPIPVRETIDIDIVNAVLQFQQLRPDITTLRYNVAEGIGYDDARGWTAWFGVGTDIPEKILIYNAIVDDLQGRGITPREINLVNPDAPYRR